ncbi:hypothetical protein SERLA73DRAFT_27661, partial [Serpula lacrymans var. lacrymans S7.3]
DRTRTALQKPENFDGEKKKYKAFREALMLNFEDDEEYFADERRKIAYVLSFMTGGAAAAFRTEWME